MWKLKIFLDVLRHLEKMDILGILHYEILKFYHFDFYHLLIFFKII